MIRLVICILALLSPTALTAAPARTEVLVLATMHGLHKTSYGYSYETLYDVVSRFHPDYVGVEIRPEDMGRDPGYLAANYPAEMIHAAQVWGPRAFGFDWLGDDVAGAPIPGDWWASRSPLKRLERALDQDARSKDEQLAAIDAARQKILASATPASLNDGRYDRLSDDYYARFRAVTAGSKFAPLADFYTDRDRHIAMAIAAAIRAHPGARIVVLTGADHRGAVVRYLSQDLGDTVRIAPVQRDD